MSDICISRADIERQQMQSSSSMKVLIIGGSGFVSGTLSRAALAHGWEVYCLTRGTKPLPSGAISLIADRISTAAMHQVVEGTSERWDLVVDCIAYEPEDVHQDIALFRGRADHFVLISTDFVFDPVHRKFPQPEESDHYASDGYGGNKRLCELALINGDTGSMKWTVLRPCHIYGPGSELGCMPLRLRDPQLLSDLQAGRSVALVGGGHFLQQPITASDLSEAILSIPGNTDVDKLIFQMAGPDIVESWQYYQIIADALGTKLTVEEIPIGEFIESNPDLAPFICHRIYSLEKLRRSGIRVPSTPIVEGLRIHVESLLHARGTRTGCE